MVSEKRTASLFKLDFDKNHCYVTKSHDVTFRYTPVQVAVEEIKGMSWAERVALMGGVKLSLVPAGSAKPYPLFSGSNKSPKVRSYLIEGGHSGHKIFLYED